MIPMWQPESVNRGKTRNKNDKKKNKQDKATNNGLQNTTQKPKERAAPTPLYTSGEHMDSVWLTLSDSLVTPVVAIGEENPDSGIYMYINEDITNYVRSK